MEEKPKISVVMPIITPTPFLQAMTEFCIKALRVHADLPFELVVVEANGKAFANHSGIDQYINFDPAIGGVKEFNAGIRAATGDFVVACGNDIFVPPHWDTELLVPFEVRKDCGLSTVAVKEAGAIIGPPNSLNLLTEGFFNAFCMWRKGWEYDETFERIYQDSDLIMRIYEAGFRSYRNNRIHIYHFGAMTNNTLGPEHTAMHEAALKRDEARFYERWQNSPLAAFSMIRRGHWIWGREYEGWLK